MELIVLCGGFLVTLAQKTIPVLTQMKSTGQGNPSWAELGCGGKSASVTLPTSITGHLHPFLIDMFFSYDILIKLNS